MIVSFRGARRAPSVATCDRDPQGQSGETLMEILCTIVLMGVAFTAILGGMVSSARVASLNQEKTRASVLAQSFAEKLLQPVGTATTYKPCAALPGTDLESSLGTYNVSPQAGTVPAGWRVRISRIVYLQNPPFAPISTDPNVKEATFPTVNSSYNQRAATINCADLPSFNPTPAQVAAGAIPRDGGLQLITITVEKPDGGGAGGYLPIESLTVTKRDQRCPPTFSNADRGPC